MKDDESDDSYLLLYAVYKTLNTTEYIYIKLFFLIKVKKVIRSTRILKEKLL